MGPIAAYLNGNYEVRLFEDGTRVMCSGEDVFHAAFPDSIDLKITDRCDGHCPMCHESSAPDGRHACLDAPFLDRLHAGTELAIGGGDALCHPGLKPFLNRMQQRGVVCNLTVNEKYLPRYADRICRLWGEGLLHGLGVSVFDLDDETVRFAEGHPNVVLHAVCGVTDVRRLLSVRAGHLKLLLLGYKFHGRGRDYFSPRVLEGISAFSGDLPRLFDLYDVVSFDNLALAQLRVKERLPDTVWQRIYGGEDGTNNLYVDLVRGVFARSSRTDETFPLLPTSEQMLDFIRQRYRLS